MSTEFIIHRGVYPGSDNGSSSEYAQGHTAAETQKVYYDRPFTLFASHQRASAISVIYETDMFMQRANLD